MATSTEQDIRSTPAILRQTIELVRQRSSTVEPRLEGPAIFLGCGSSYCMGIAGAALYERARGAPAQAMLASEYRPRAGWTHIAISRTGRTTELVQAMRRAREAGAHVLLIRGEPNSPAEAQAGTVLPLEFASEQGVIQTRIVTAFALTLRLLLGGPSEQQPPADLPDRLERALGAFDPVPWTRYGHVVFLGRDWRLGLAAAAALNLQETAQVVPEAHQTLDYRHGPITNADLGTLIWCFDPAGDRASAGVLDDARRAGATVRCTDDDPLITLALSQLVAVRVAENRGVNPDEPRHISRAIELPDV